MPHSLSMGSRFGDSADHSITELNSDRKKCDCRPRSMSRRAVDDGAVGLGADGHAASPGTVQHSACHRLARESEPRLQRNRPKTSRCRREIALRASWQLFLRRSCQDLL